MDKVRNLFVRLKNLPKKKKILLLVVLVVFVTPLLIYGVFSNDEEVFNPSEVITYSTNKPSEKEVEDFEVPNDMPREITLPTIDKTGFIQIVSIDQHGDIAVPSNVLMAGWYINSVRPGDVGLSIMTGHRDGVVKSGVFKELGDLKKEDTFEIEFGDSSVRNFRVVEIKKVSIEEAYDLLYEKRDYIVKQLNLITCSGTYLKEEQTYDQRTIVISERVE